MWPAIFFHFPLLSFSFHPGPNPCLLHLLRFLLLDADCSFTLVQSACVCALLQFSPWGKWIRTQRDTLTIYTWHTQWLHPQTSWRSGLNKYFHKKYIISSYFTKIQYIKVQMYQDVCTINPCEKPYVLCTSLKWRRSLNVQVLYMHLGWITQKNWEVGVKKPCKYIPLCLHVQAHIFI